MISRRSRPQKIFLAAFLIIGAVPFASMLVFSLFAKWPADSLLPQTPTLDGFRYFFKRDYITAVNSTLFSMLVSLLTTALCIPAARGLHGMSRGARRLIEPLFYFPMLLPVVSISIGSHKLFLSVSVIGTAAVLLMHIYFAIPYVFQIVYSAQAVISLSAETAAKNLGADKLSIFLHIHLPAYLPDYLSAYAMGFIISYSQYFVNFYLGNSGNINFSMVLAPLITGSNRNVASVYSLMYLLFGAAVLLLCSAIPKMLHMKEAARNGAN